MDIVRKVGDVEKADAELHRGGYVENVARVLNHRRNFTPIFQTFIGIVVQDDVLENGQYADRYSSEQRVGVRSHTGVQMESAGKQTVAKPP